MKKLLVISSSFREGSNSELLAREFMRGAIAAGNEAKIVTLKGKKLGFFCLNLRSSVYSWVRTPQPRSTVATCAAKAVSPVMGRTIASQGAVLTAGFISPCSRST